MTPAEIAFCRYCSIFNSGSSEAEIDRAWRNYVALAEADMKRSREQLATPTQEIPL